MGWGFIQVRRKSECERIPIGGSIMLLARAGFRSFIYWNEVGRLSPRSVASTVMTENFWVYDPTHCSYHSAFDTKFLQFFLVFCCIRSFEDQCVCCCPNGEGGEVRGSCKSAVFRSDHEYKMFISHFEGFASVRGRVNSLACQNELPSRVPFLSLEDFGFYCLEAP